MFTSMGPLSLVTCILFAVKFCYHQAGLAACSRLIIDQYVPFATVSTAAAQLEIDDVLGSCIHPADSLQEHMTDDATIICTHKQDVRRHNTAALHWHARQGTVQQIHTVEPMFEPLLSANNPELLPWVDKHHQLLEVAVGARVMFTATLDKRSGKVNGARGTVTALELEPNGFVERIIVQLDSNGRQVKVGRCHAPAKRIGDVLTTITTFPLTLCYAITAHKCQGMTITGRAILHIRNAFAAGIVYVMLSRVTNRRNLVILDGLSPDMIVPVPLSLEAASS
jgi:hypothetical protein